MFVRRRRPLVRAAMVGGTAYVAGKHVSQTREREARLQDLEAVEAAQPAAPAPSAGGTDLVAELTRLKELESQGALTAEEFAAAKQKLLAG